MCLISIGIKSEDEHQRETGPSPPTTRGSTDKSLENKVLQYWQFCIFILTSYWIFCQLTPFIFAGFLAQTNS